jgi:hypothetical protein
MVSTIFSSIMATLVTSLLVSRSSYLSADTYIQVQQEVRRAFDNIVRELHESGRINNSVSVAEPGVQRLDFQIVRSYDVAACGGPCWGTDDAVVPTGWIHYVLDTANLQNARLMRCITANQLDPMPLNFAGCQVLANNINTALASTTFVYDHPTRTVTVRLQALITSQQLPGGSLGTAPSPLTTRVRLRNAS